MECGASSQSTFMNALSSAAAALNVNAVGATMSTSFVDCDGPLFDALLALTLELTLARTRRYSLEAGS